MAPANSISRILFSVSTALFLVSSFMTAIMPSPYLCFRSCRFRRGRAVTCDAYASFVIIRREDVGTFAVLAQIQTQEFFILADTQSHYGFQNQKDDGRSHHRESDCCGNGH